MIEQIKQALEKATPGPWKGKHAITPYISVSSGVVDEVIATVVMRNNLQLLANAPEWLRYLVGEVERLQHERDNALSLRNVSIKHYNTVKEENEMLLRELAEYREEEPRPRFKMDAQGNLTLIEEE